MINFKATKLRDRILWGYSIPILLSVGAATLVFLNAKEVEAKGKILNNSNAIVISLKHLELGLQVCRNQLAAIFWHKRVVS